MVALRTGWPRGCVSPSSGIWPMLISPKAACDLSEADDQPVTCRLHANLVLTVEHVGRHMGDDDAPGLELVPVNLEVGVAKVVGDVLVALISLGDEEVRACGNLDEIFCPGGVACVCDYLARYLKAQ